MRRIKTLPYGNTLIIYDHFCYIKNWKPNWKGRYLLLINKGKNTREYIRLYDNTTYYFVKSQNDQNVPCYNLKENDELYAVYDDEIIEDILPEVL